MHPTCSFACIKLVQLFGLHIILGPVWTLVRGEDCRKVRRWYQFSSGHIRTTRWVILVDSIWTEDTGFDHRLYKDLMHLPCLQPPRRPLWFIVLWVFTVSLPPPSHWKTANLKIDFKKWISTRSSLQSEASANIRKSCTYGFVYPRSSSPSTWWWVSLQDPRRLTAAGRARSQWPGISPPSPGHSV